MLNETRKAAAAILLKARNGEDVAGEKRAARERAKHVKPEKTTGEIVRTYLALKQSAVRPSTYREIERHLLKFFAPLHDRPIETIGRRDIVEIVDGLVIRGKCVQADRLKTNCVTFFNWCLEYDYLQADPASGISRRTPPEQLARDRVLSMDEIAAICSETGGHSDYDKALRLLILAGARRREIGGLQWQEIDFDTAEIRLPKERVKNKMAHTIFLSTPALAILKTVEQKKGKPTLFGRTSGAFDDRQARSSRRDERTSLK